MLKKNTKTSQWSWKSSEIPDPSDPYDPLKISLTWTLKAAPVLQSKHTGEGTSKAWHPQHHICHCASATGETIRFNRSRVGTPTVDGRNPAPPGMYETL